MNEGTSIKETDLRIIERISFIWLISLFCGFFLALLGVFSTETIAAILAASLLAGLILIFRLKPSHTLVAISMSAFLYASVIGFFSTPSVFSGRDQGSYANAAISLATSHALAVESPSVNAFFQLYGPGKALNFPGFFYDESGKLVTQFPLGSIIWFAENFAIFGVAGLTIANTLTLTASLILFFLLLRNFTTTHFATAGTIIIALSFPIIWFSKFTLSENLALTLFLLSSFHLIRFFEKPNRFSIILATTGLVFLAITRIEGFFMLAVAIILLGIQKKTRSFLLAHLPSMIILKICLLIILILDIFNNLPFYQAIGSALIKDANHATETSAGSALLSGFERTIELSWTYGFVSVFLLAALGFLFFCLQRNARSHALTIPLLLAAPTVLYLVSPHIAADHPWELRRLAFSLWPATLLLAIFAASHIREKIEQHYGQHILLQPHLFAAIFVSLAILPSIPASAPVFFFSDNQELLQQTEHFSQKFSQNDLILIDRETTGDPFSMIPAPMRTLFAKQAVYFFNPDDLPRLDIKAFDHVYLVATNEDIGRYQAVLDANFTFTPAYDFSFDETRLTTEKNASLLPIREHTLASGTAYLLNRR